MTTIQTATVSTTSTTKPATKKSKDKHPCLCGSFAVVNDSGDTVVDTQCSDLTNKVFAMGHDSKLKSILIHAMVNKFEMTMTQDGITTRNTASNVARMFGFLAQVQNGATKLNAKKDRRAHQLEVRTQRIQARIQAREAAKSERMIERAYISPKLKKSDEAFKEIEAIVDAKLAPVAAGTPANIKVGRWVYPGTVNTDGTASYANKKTGELVIVPAGKFTVV